MAQPPTPGNTLASLLTSDTFRTWFDRSNQIIGLVNPIEVYGITNDVLLPGITFSIDSDGIANLGLSLPGYITGDFIFGGGITFEGDIITFTGNTVDFGGATLAGRVVRTVNGMTGDVIISGAGLNLPAGMTTGDILVYDAAGETLEKFSLFTGGTFENNYINFANTGGMILGAATQDAGNFRPGSIQLMGGGTSSILFRDTTYTGNVVRRIGTFITHKVEGDNVYFRIQGGDTSGVFDTDTNAPYITIEGSDREIGILGITMPEAPIHYLSRSGVSADIVLQLDGKTAGIGIGKDEDGDLDLDLYPDQRLRVILNKTNKQAFLEVQGSHGEGRKNVFKVGQTGDVIIGGDLRTDGGTLGSLNLASGSLYVGGRTGAANTVLISNGVTVDWGDMAGGFEQALVQDADGNYNSNTATTGTITGLQLNRGKNVSITGSIVDGNTLGITIGSFVQSKTLGETITTESERIEFAVDSALADIQTLDGTDDDGTRFRRYTFPKGGGSGSGLQGYKFLLDNFREQMQVDLSLLVLVMKKL